MVLLLLVPGLLYDFLQHSRVMLIRYRAYRLLYTSNLVHHLFGKFTLPTFQTKLMSTTPNITWQTAKH